MQSAAGCAKKCAGKLLVKNATMKKRMVSHRLADPMDSTTRAFANCITTLYRGTTRLDSIVRGKRAANERTKTLSNNATHATPSASLQRRSRQRK